MRKRCIFDKIYVAAAVLVIIVLLAVFLFTGDNFQLLKSLFSTNITEDELRQTTEQLGWDGYLTVGLIAMLQVLCPFLPAQPVQVLAGIAYGVPIGFSCCYAGFFIGSTAILLLFRLFGNRLRKFFMKDTQIDMQTLAHSGRISIIIVLLFCIPALPYAMICFFAASIGFSFRRYTLVNSLGVIPSIIAGVGLGQMTISSDPIVTTVVFLVLIALLCVILWKRAFIFTKLSEFAVKPPYSSKTTVRKCNRAFFSLVYVFASAYYYLRGIRVKTESKVGKKLQGPCVVLCNHGSFIDFYYSAKLLRKSNFNFISARLYFYHKWLGRIMKLLGCFPKSMFATDMESTKNCMKVIREGRMLVIMPEARLSTVGEFEDIQDRTYSFLKKLNVPVYTIKISGDYLANPKWGKGLRRGSLVEAVLDILFSPEQLQNLSLQEIKEGVETRLDYNEFAWLAERPNIRYKSKRLAEGLENILALCPVCGKQHTIRTKGHTISCEHCGELTLLNDRYGFTKGFRFENFAGWYHWQKSQLQKNIRENPQFCLRSMVQFRLPDPTGKSITRYAGDGECTLDRSGLTYNGTKDGERITKHFPIAHIYRLLFGAGENFEVYSGTEIQYFVPEEKRSAVDWYMASMILYDLQAADSKVVNYE